MSGSLLDNPDIFIYASNEPKSVLARDLEEGGLNIKNGILSGENSDTTFSILGRIGVLLTKMES